MKILAVEDNALDARLLREYFREAGVPVTLDVVDRLNDAKARLPDAYEVVLLDLSLPDASGPATVTQVHKAAPSVPIVVLTGLDDEDAALRAVQEGAQDYLVKGRFDGALLLRSIRYAIERKRAEEQSLKLLREQEARAQAEERANRSRLLADVSRVLVSNVDYRQTVPIVATLTVPIVGDYCVIDVIEPTGESRRLAATHADPSLEPVMARLQQFPPSRQGRMPSSLALSSTEAVVVNDVSPEVFDAAEDPQHREVMRTLNPRHALSAPMLVRGRTTGVLSLGRAGPDAPAFSAEDAGFITELAGRIALAIENSQLVRAREEMMSIVSHDLRTPLSVIALSAGALERGAPTPEARARQLVKINRAVQQMTRLIDDLLDFARIEAGALPISLATVPAAELVDEALERLRPVADERGVRLLADESLPGAWVLADRERCLQVFANLLGNALKFTPAGGQVTVVAAPDGGQVCFRVRDTGPGVSADDLPRLFDRFWQGGREKRRGAGLGLAIARGIVQAHGGRIWCESRLGDGATFVFTLPAAEARSAAVSH